MCKTLFSILLIIICSCVCKKQSEPNQGDFDPPNIDPEKVPEEISLFNPKPLILMKFKASENGYSMETFRAKGTPTLAANPSDDIIIVGFGGQGDTMRVIKLFNPRVLYTTGTSELDSVILKTATFPISFLKSDSIHLITLTVQRGPNAGLEANFPIGDFEELPVIP